MTLRGRGIEVKKLNREKGKRKKEKKNEKKEREGEKERKKKGKRKEERENFPPDHRRRNPAPPPIPWLRLII